jgi:hypothetical protein
MAAGAEGRRGGRADEEEGGSTTERRRPSEGTDESAHKGFRAAGSTSKDRFSGNRATEPETGPRGVHADRSATSTAGSAASDSVTIHGAIPVQRVLPTVPPSAFGASAFAIPPGRQRQKQRIQCSGRAVYALVQCPGRAIRALTCTSARAIVPAWRLWFTAAVRQRQATVRFHVNTPRQYGQPHWPQARMLHAPRNERAWDHVIPIPRGRSRVRGLRPRWDSDHSDR